MTSSAISLSLSNRCVFRRKSTPQGIFILGRNKDNVIKYSHEIKCHFLSSRRWGQEEEVACRRVGLLNVAVSGVMMPVFSSSCLGEGYQLFCISLSLGNLCRGLPGLRHPYQDLTDNFIFIQGWCPWKLAPWCLGCKRYGQNLQLCCIK